MLAALLAAASPTPLPMPTAGTGVGAGIGTTPVPMPSATVTDPGCAALDLVCKAKAGVADAVAAGGADAVTSLAGHVEQALGTVLASLGAAWVNVRTPQLVLSTSGVGNPTDAVGYLQGHLQFYMLGFAMAGVMVGGARMAWEQRASLGLEVFRAIAILLLVATSGVTLVSLATVCADGLAESILASATSGTDFGHNVVALFRLDKGLAAVLVIVFGLGALFVSCLQIMLMVARAAMVVVLSGVLPTTASATNTAAGKAALHKSVGWLAAFIAYKPAAAIIYAAAFRLTGSKAFGADGVTNILVGLVLMVLALVALPALMRLAVPAVAALASSSGGLAVAATAAAAIPSGAIAARSAWGRGGAAPTGSTSPRGPSGGPGTSGPIGGPGGGGGAGPTGAAGTSGTAGAATTAAKGAGAAGGPAGLVATTVIATAAQAAAKTAKGAADTATGKA